MKWKYYHTIWLVLFLGWTISFVDRNLLSPIVDYMIRNKVAFFANAANPHALAGLFSTLFFAGYMAMQFPAGFIGDRFGRKPIMFISLIWAAIGSALSGLLTGSVIGLLIGRVVTGLGEGCYYSNDRALISQVTPKAKLGVGMGASFIGIGIGVVGASVGGAWTLQWAIKAFGPERGWPVPFYIMAIPTLVIACILWVVIKNPHKNPELYAEGIATIEEMPKEDFLKTFSSILKYAVVFFVVIIAVAFAGITYNLNNVAISILLLALAVGIMLYAMTVMGKAIGPAFFNRELQLLYWSGLPCLWSFWFYSFWAIKVIGDASKTTGLSVAAMTAAMFGLAAIVGLPMMGKIGDVFYQKGYGRKPALALALAIHAVFIFGLAWYLHVGGSSVYVLGALVFGAGAFLFGNWAVQFSMLADMAPPGLTASVFGLNNLIIEVGAILSPVVSGAMRDAYNSWVPSIVLDGVLMVIAVLLVLAVREYIPNIANKDNFMSVAKTGT